MDSQGNSDLFDRKELNRLEEDLKCGRKRRQGQYFRLNVEFRGQEPRLDDPTKMPEMKLLAHELILHSKQLDRLARCIVAELFIFELELETIPRKENGQYSCTGYIMCCHRAGTPVFEALLRRLTQSSAKFLLKGRGLPGSVCDRSSAARDGNFRKRVCFNVNNKQDSISIHLREQGFESHDISGSPFSVDWLIKAQFGGPGGVKRRRKDSDDGFSRKRQRQQ